VEDLDLKHEEPKSAYWATKHARDPAIKAEMRCGMENVKVLLFEEQHADGREVDSEGEVGESLVEEGRRDCCSSVSGSCLYESSPASTSAWDSFIFGGDDGGVRRGDSKRGFLNKVCTYTV
jgi:hypothetical protein